MAPRIGTRAACRAAGVAQATWYRRHRASPPAPKPAPVPHAERVQPRALAPAERQVILEALHSERFADLAPDEVWATLLDEGTYLGSVSTYYRVLREAGESRERRAQATHPAAVKPELVATGPNQVYSWDITKLHGPAKWTYYLLLVIVVPRAKAQVPVRDQGSANLGRGPEPDRDSRTPFLGTGTDRRGNRLGR
jgi:putative transposase